jgi:uncharacterized Tic20 family protein
VRWLHLAWAAVPTFLAGLLVWQSTREDSYISDGSSYWATHSDGRVWVVVAVAFDLIAAAVLLALRRERLLVVTGSVLTVIAVLVSVAAGFAITAN